MTLKASFTRRCTPRSTGTGRGSVSSRVATKVCPAALVPTAAMSCPGKTAYSAHLVGSKGAVSSKYVLLGAPKGKAPSKMVKWRPGVG